MSLKRRIKFDEKKEESKKEENKVQYEFGYKPVEIPQTTEPISTSIQGNIRKDPKYQEPLFYIASQHIQRIMGHRPPLSVEDKNVRCINKTYLSQAEKRRQFERASTERQKDKLLEKYGIKDHKELMHDVHYTRELLKNGEKSLDFLHPKNPVTQRTKELALSAILPRSSEPQQETRNSDAKKNLKKIKSAENRRAATLLVEKVEKKKAKNIPAEKPKKAPVESLSNNLIVENVEVKLKKSKNSVKQLKEKLKMEIEKRKQVEESAKKGEEELEEEWEVAKKKASGEKVETFTTISRNLDRALKKEKKRGAALKAVIDRQDQARHKKLMKKSQNVRDRRVSKQASKLVKLEKRGRVIPGFT